ncbi:hypothetical protein G6727_08345 [Polynucleobacter paneuropaeus]|nr:hypothetical protein [Polynucleobacter paneuropaeus]
MKPTIQIIPKFKTESDERKFWEQTDTTRYFDLSNFMSANFPNLKNKKVDRKLAALKKTVTSKEFD